MLDRIYKLETIRRVFEVLRLNCVIFGWCRLYAINPYPPDLYPFPAIPHIAKSWMG